MDPFTLIAAANFAFKGIKDLCSMYQEGKAVIKDIQKTIKYTGLRDFNERPDYHSNLWGSCSVEAKLIDNSDNWHKPHTRIKYLGVA